MAGFGVKDGLMACTYLLLFVGLENAWLSSTLMTNMKVAMCLCALANVKRARITSSLLRRLDGLKLLRGWSCVSLAGSVTRDSLLLSIGDRQLGRRRVGASGYSYTLHVDIVEAVLFCRFLSFCPEGTVLDEDALTLKGFSFSWSVKKGKGWNCPICGFLLRVSGVLGRLRMRSNEENLLTAVISVLREKLERCLYPSCV